MKILIADDENILVKGVKFNLENDGFTVLTAENGIDAVGMVRGNDIDLVILDIMMPKMDGITACKEIRKFSDIPIIILTAKSEDKDKLLGFDCGADDYLTKPFNVLELKARIKALLRRREGTGDVITLGHISIDTNSRTAFKSGQRVELATKEFDILMVLMKTPGKIFSREELMTDVWGTAPQADTDIRTVDVHIRRLREKLELDPDKPTRIMTRWKAGYYFQV